MHRPSVTFISNMLWSRMNGQLKNKIVTNESFEISQTRILHNVSLSLIIPIHSHPPTQSLHLIIESKHVPYFITIIIYFFSLFTQIPRSLSSFHSNISHRLLYSPKRSPLPFSSPLPYSLLSQHVSPLLCWSGAYPWVAARPWILRGKQFLGDNVLISRGSSDSI